MGDVGQLRNLKAGHLDADASVWKGFRGTEGGRALGFELRFRIWGLGFMI